MSWTISKSKDTPFEFVIGVAWLGNERQKILYIGLFWHIALTFNLS